MSIPNLADLAKQIFDARPDDVAALRAVCDATDAFRNQFGEDDPRVQAGEHDANNRKGAFTRRIAWACYQHDQRFGLREKTIGGIATRPSDGLTHATDVLMWKDTGEIGDVMSDRDVSWSWNPADTQPVEQWVKPLPEDGEPAPAPVPVPTPTPEPEPMPTVDLSELIAAVRAVRETVIALGREIDTMKDQIQELASKPDPAVTLPPWPSYSGKIPYLGTVKLTPESK